ncbi:hypothetical protein EWU48_03345 [Enterococcus faecium]|nr:hypothetical protein EWU48_03345 [Enterococcus faecium]TAQ19777.1 hypothetical protein EWU51_03165 [Enterococcus faecium]
MTQLKLYQQENTRNQTIEQLTQVSVYFSSYCGSPFSSAVFSKILPIRRCLPFVLSEVQVDSVTYLSLSSKDVFFKYFACSLGQFTRNYTQTVKRAADNKRRYAPGWVHSTCLLRGFPKGAAPHLAHDFAEQSVVCYTLCRRCPENTVAAGEGKGI